MKFFKKSIWVSLASLAFALQSFITNKLFSIYFGPQGVTLLAHFQNLVAIFTTVPNDGINRGVIKFLADPTIDKNYWNRYASSAVLLNLVSFFIMLAIIAASYETYAESFPAGVFSWIHICVILLGIFLHIAALLLSNIILSSGHIQAYALLSILNNGLGLAVICFGIPTGLSNSVVYLSLYPTSALIPIIYYFAKYHKVRLSQFVWQYDKKSIYDISQFILIALSTVIFGRMVDFFVRDYVILKYSAFETGLWQGVVKISDGYSTLFNAAFGTLFFVQISSLASSSEELKPFIKKVFWSIIPLCFVVLAIVWLLREYILILLYNQDFVSASHYMDYQVIADFFKFPSWMLGFIILAQVRTSLYIITQAASTIVYCVLIWLLLPHFHLDALPMANCFRFIFFFFMMAFIHRKLIF